MHLRCDHLESLYDHPVHDAFLYCNLSHVFMIPFPISQFYKLQVQNILNPRSFRYFPICPASGTDHSIPR